MSTAQRDPVLRYIRQLVASREFQERTDQELLDDFAASRKEAAFAALVARHGPMVLRVCHRVLGHEQDAEDAFQATFLVLAHKNASIRKREALADWLHGVAYRTAMKAKRSAARRRTREQQLRPTSPPSTTPTWPEVQATLDEELRKLSEPFRQAFVLCVLEGKSGPQAAVALGCKEGTVSSRVTRARQQLQRQLTRRGINLGALLAGLAIAEGVPQAVAGVLVHSTVRYGLLAAAGATAASQIPAHVSALAQGVSGAMFSTKLKLATVVLLTASLLTAGAGVVARQVLATTAPPPGSQKPEIGSRNPAPAVAKPPAPNAKGDRIEVSGRVVDPEGKPVRDARLVFVYPSVERVPAKVWATSAADGRFHFAVAKSIEEAAWSGNAWDHTYVVAASAGYGFGWARVRPEGPGDVTLQLVKDDTPLGGRLRDLQGQPVVGATVRIDGHLWCVPTKGDLAEWLQALMANPRNSDHMDATDYAVLSGPSLAILFPPVQTGADGRFQIQGIGRERVVSLLIEGPTIATQQVKVMTRPGERIQPTPKGQGRLGPVTTYHGAPCDLVMMPTRHVVGVVRDKDTGKPLAGVTVRSHRIHKDFDLNGLVRTTTDKEGRYRLVGLPKGEGNAIIAETYGHLSRTDDRPYLAAIRAVGNPPGLEPVTVDMAMKRGIWVKGRVLDKATGRPVPAGFDYFCLADNPHAGELPLLERFPGDYTDKDGSFQLVALPGRGLIAVRAVQNKYLMAVGADQIKGQRIDKLTFDTDPYHLYAGNFHTIVEVSPGPEDESITCNVVLEPGYTLKGTVVDPDGKPLSGAIQVAGLRPMGYWEKNLLKEGTLTLWGLRPDKPRLLHVKHEGKRLVGWIVVHGDEKDPLRVRLEPWGTFTGRLVSPDGDPVTNASIRLGGRAVSDSSAGGSSVSTRSDKNGMFRIEGLAPGLKYAMSVSREPGYTLEISGKNINDLMIKAGATRDLGDIQVKPME